MLVTVPDGVSEGMPFRVQLPPISHDTVVMSPQQQQQQQANRRSIQSVGSQPAPRQVNGPPTMHNLPPPGPAPSSAGRLSVNQRPGASSQARGGAPPSGDRLMAVVVPPRYRAGMVMEIMVPGKGRMRVAIPEGVGPGEQFRFRVPI